MKKTMLEKIELFRQLVTEIDISKYEQKEFAEIVRTLSLEIFTADDIEALRNMRIEQE
jgi:hypothetical protein